MHRQQRSGYTGSDSDGSTPRDERWETLLVLHHKKLKIISWHFLRFSTPRLSARMGGSSSDGEWATPRSQVGFGWASDEGEYNEWTPRDADGNNELKGQRSSSHNYSELKDRHPPQPSPLSHLNTLKSAEPKIPEYGHREQLAFREQHPSSRSAMSPRLSNSEFKEAGQRWSDKPFREYEQRWSDQQPPTRSATLETRQSYREVEEHEHQILDIFSFARHSRVDEVIFVAVFVLVCLVPLLSAPWPYRSKNCLIGVFQL